MAAAQIIDIASESPIATEDPNHARKAMLKVAVPAVTISAGGIVNLPMAIPGSSNYKILSRVYIFVVFMSFSFGMGLLLLSMVLSRAHISVSVGKKLMWVVLAMVQLALAIGTVLVVMG